MICHKTALTGCSVFSCKAYAAILLKLVKHKQITLRACSKQENRLAAYVIQPLAEVKQRRNSHAAAHQKHFILTIGRHREAVAQRKHAVQHVACLKTGKAARAVANSRNKQPQLVGVIINEIHRDGAAQESGGRTVNPYLDKLPNVRFLLQKYKIWTRNPKDKRPNS